MKIVFDTGDHVCWVFWANVRRLLLKETIFVDFCAIFIAFWCLKQTHSLKHTHAHTQTHTPTHTHLCADAGAHALTHT